MNKNNNKQFIMPLNLKLLRTRFTLHFLSALKKINSNNTNNNSFMVAKRYKKVKVAAEASLASAVGPGRAWTRAIIAGRARPGSHHHVVVRKRRRRISRSARPEARRVEELKRLVPGGESMNNMHSLLDETLHYIMCLTTQVKVMRSIVDVCST